VDEQLTDALREHLAQASQVSVAYLFGSEARGEARSGSDVDIAVLLASGRPKKLMDVPTRLQEELAQIAGRPVDLVVLQEASPDLVHRILRDGVLLYERDGAERIAFEVRARNEYFDILPYIERYRAARGAES
jgi:uncharacterized protein